MSIERVVGDDYDFCGFCVNGEDDYYFYFWFNDLIYFVWIIVGFGC